MPRAPFQVLVFPFRRLEEGEFEYAVFKRADEGYWQAIQPVLQHHEVLLIADEVVCGFGRLGTPFGSNRYGIDINAIGPRQ